MRTIEIPRRATFRVHDVAQLYGVSTRTVYRWINELGLFPNAYKLTPYATNSPIIIPREDLVNYEQAREDSSRAEWEAKQARIEEAKNEANGQR